MLRIQLDTADSVSSYRLCCPLSAVSAPSTVVRALPRRWVALRCLVQPAGAVVYASSQSPVESLLLRLGADATAQKTVERSARERVRHTLPVCPLTHPLSLSMNPRQTSPRHSRGPPKHAPSSGPPSLLMPSARPQSTHAGPKTLGRIQPHLAVSGLSRLFPFPLGGTSLGPIYRIRSDDACSLHAVCRGRSKLYPAALMTSMYAHVTSYSPACTDPCRRPLTRPTVGSQSSRAYVFALHTRDINYESQLAPL